MSILIKGAEMPKNCWKCLGNDLCVAIAKLGGACPFTERVIGRNEFDAHSGIHPDCPLVEIPPHGDLIDKDKLVNVLFDLLDDSDKPVHDMLLEVETAPTVIESEVEE